MGTITSMGDLPLLGLTSGSAKLRLRTLDGGLFDQITVEAAVPAHLAVGCAGHVGEPIHLRKGERCSLQFQAEDSNGRELALGDGITLALGSNIAYLTNGVWTGDSLVVAAGPFLVANLQAISAGQVTLSIHVGDASGTTPVTIN